MNILVTGGAGFIGSHVVDRFIDAGHKIVVVDNLSHGKKANLNPRAKFYKLDINSKKIRDVIVGEKIELINHHAAQIDLRFSVANPAVDAHDNIIGSINLMQAAVGTRVRKVIFASTGGAMYGFQHIFPTPESHPQNPLSPYAISKLSVEKYLGFYQYVHGIEYVVLRYANVYGPRQDAHGEAGVVAIFTEKMLRGEKTVINGDGKQTRDYVYVGDVAEANMRAIVYPKSDVFNVGVAIETDVNEIWTHVKKLTGYKAKMFHGPAKKGEQIRSVLDYAKIRKAMGWRPMTDLETGLAETVDWFRSRM